ncbi:Hypothetical protein A7982_02728 [Minicystis rosea]|nr:Hypothetical protein A7982_02728 [Minicystis rosea]
MSDESIDANPYDPPVDVAPAIHHGDGGRRQGALAVVHFVAAFGLIFVAFAAAALFRERMVAAVGMSIVALIFLAGFFRGIVAMVQAARAKQATLGFTLGVFVVVLANGFMSWMGALLAMFATSGFSRGRQLRRFGRVLLPEVREGRAWAELPLTPTIEAPVQRALAAQWRENGRTEHASVAAFARLTLDLMALGAPPALIAAANRDALDEIRHAELCFSLARALDGADESPAAFPEAQRARTLPATRPLALAALAVDSLVDGALHEGISARVIARLVKRCEDPATRAVLKEIAADEGRHAAHGWDVVRWCLAEGGTVVADALRGAVAVLPTAVHSSLPEAADDGSWERFGIHGRALEAEEHASTRADVVRRVEKLIGPARAAA